MILHRLRLSNFRGIDEREIAFPDRGVVVVCGANEIGKSSMIEALDLLLNYKDRSGHKDVKAVKPTHADVGAEVEAGELRVGDGVLRGVEVVEVRELVAEGVADAAIGLADFLQALLADGDVGAVVLAGDPQAQHVGAVFVHVTVGGLRLGVSALALLALGNLLAVLVHHEPVGEHSLERRDAVAGEGEEQGGLKPAAMLVGAFEIDVGLPGGS